MSKTSALFLAAALAAGTMFAQNDQKKKQAPPSVQLNKEYTTASGLKYKIIRKGKGKSPKKGNQVSVHYVGTLTDSAKTKFDSSYDRGEPYSFLIGIGQVIKGWDEGIALLHVGDMAILTIPSKLAYGRQGSGRVLPNATLVFQVELMDVKELPKPWNVKGLKVDSTADGLKYIVVKKGTGKKPVKGKTITVMYSEYLSGSMKLIDSSVQRDRPYLFSFGTGEGIKGWEEGISLMRVGSKMRLIIPYPLGYGEAGNPPDIPAKATLIFDVEFLSVD
ncbi:MAG: FKBP-type peptidyl-prolyl cis-trans isomerase [Bacteroidia bacterium]